MPYQANEARYREMPYRRCGKSGLLLPTVSLGLWRNFGGLMPLENSRAMLRTAFDLGVTHFDLANNYGPPPGSAEEAFGEILKKDFLPYRDELIVSSKAGYTMWEGPYGDHGSRKYLIASIDQSLKRTGLSYFDIFYHHRPDPDTPLEETMSALDQIVRSGKALYVGLSNYRSADARRAAAILKELGTPCVIHQPSYSLLNRWVEEDRLLDATDEAGLGVIVFSPLMRGRLTDRMAASPAADVDEATAGKLAALASLAHARGQSLSQMALAWVLRDRRVTSALIGASSPAQVADSVGAVKNLSFTEEELSEIGAIIA